MGKSEDRSKTLITVGVLAVIAVIGFLLWRSGTTSSSKADPTPTVAKTMAPANYKPRPPRMPTNLPKAKPPIIDEVIVEKSELCAGEENLITVRAHSEYAEDDIHLRGMVAGKPGLIVPIIARANRAPERGPLTVVVFARDGMKATAEIPAFKVNDCKVARVLEINYRLYPNTNSTFEFRAEIHNVAADTAFDAVSYEWSFGDGSDKETTERTVVVHDFSKRPQDALHSNLLVQVVARNAADETLVGRRGLVIRNAEYSNLINSGTVTLVVELTPRFPVIEEGVVTQGVKLWHHREEPITVERLRARRNSNTVGVAPVLVEVPIESVLGTTTIPPEGISFSLQIDGTIDPDLGSIDYLLDGVSADDYPVASVFSVMKPTLPTRDKHIPVSALKQKKILRARELLEKAFVTDEDLWRLEREGAFKDIHADGPEAPPAEMPPAFNPTKRDTDEPAQPGPPKLPPKQ